MSRTYFIEDSTGAVNLFVSNGTAAGTHKVAQVGALVSLNLQAPVPAPDSRQPRLCERRLCL